MSPRQANPRLRDDLVEAAARLLAEEGPQALTTRRLASAVGSSTTAVYTHFGGMDDLVRAMVHEGFALLDRRMSAVSPSGDPVTDVAALGLAYHGNALEHRHLYGVMFGGAGLGGFSLTDEDRQYGRYTLEPVVRAVTAAMAAGRFREGDARLVAHQMWIALHGAVTLELGGFLVPPYDAGRCFAAQVHGLLVGAGDTPSEARRSLERLGVPLETG
ncbi:TetR/AcrR family transcriptional regulator [Streptomyces sp. NPDC046985]|uniref:TetR/AcrR family transcriptional regulator n=1 Tax=Streptomyces sp. NPDC046985 TaxID=3155377 RepID=UPI0033FEAA93